MTGPQRILIIDDERDMREVASIALTHSGFTVFQAGDGKAGLKAIEEHDPNIILVDMMMPGMTGLEFCRKLIDMGGGNIPVIMISAVSESAQVVRDFLDLPLQKKCFIRKPFDALELVDQIRAFTGTAPAPAPQPPKPAAAPAPPTPAKPALTAADTPQYQGYRIMIIDDDPSIRQIMNTVLGMFHKTETAVDGMDALEKLDRFLPDFILSDINMPQMNGLECAKAIRRHPRIADVPIFFLTGEQDKNLPRVAYDIGGNLYLRKPMDPLQVLKAIDRFLGEMRIEREGYFKRWAGKPAPVAAATAPSAPVPASPAPTPNPDEPVRVVVIHNKPEPMAQLREIFETRAGALKRIGAYDVIYCTDDHTALAQLPRWEPDVILYQPRDMHYDGIAFSQMLRIKKVYKDTEIAFIGDEFQKIEIEHSQKNFKRNPIDMLRGEHSITEDLMKIIATAATHVRSKSQPFREVLREDREAESERREKQDKANLQKSMLKRRYQDLQKFIDGNCV